jgi:hypothetical protein
MTSAILNFAGWRMTQQEFERFPESRHPPI